MTQLIKNIEGKAYTENKGITALNKSIKCEIQLEDYINLNGLIMCLQNLSATEKTSRLITPIMLGLANKNNIEIVTLQISY